MAKATRNNLPLCSVKLFKSKTETPQDPLIGCKHAAQAFAQGMLTTFVNARGAADALGAAGSLGGFSCQMGVRTMLARSNRPLGDGLMEIATNNGQKFYFGDSMNEPLFSANFSLLNIAGGAAKNKGCTKFPNMAELVGHVASTVGSETFAHPRLPEGTLSYLPADYVRNYWNYAHGLLVKHQVDAQFWPIMFGLAAQEIILGANIPPPELAITIVMECAIPASKLNPVAMGIAV